MAFDFAPTVLAWYDEHGRKTLPWQQNINPYRVWVSEIMLQQTQVTTVIPYYERFMQSFPTVVALADAEQEDVLHHWTGLGYYARARNLHKAARIVRDEHSGEFPVAFEKVLALPGIGRSTAGAILAISTGQRYAILDGNVKRVLARFFAVDGWPGLRAVEEQLWQYAEALTPTERLPEYTQVMMDLGATVCARSKPRCEHCPIQTQCLAYVQGRVSELPARKPKKDKPEKYTHVFVPVHKGRVLMYKRPESGIWGGLWWFASPDGFTEKCLAQPHWDDYLSREGLKGQTGQLLPSIRHTFSHFHLNIQPILVEVSSITEVAEHDSGKIWVDWHEPEQIGLCAPAVTILEYLQNQY